MKRRTLYLFLALCVALVLASTLTPFSPYSWAAFKRGQALRHELLTALDNAASVQVIEHTCREDDPATLYDAQFKEKTLETVTLTPKQIADLRSSLPFAGDISGTTVTACIFEEHHRIEINETDSRKVVLRLCFHCGELELNGGGQRIMPHGWPASLSQFIASLGLHPNGPW
jgi:hypothetical protein